MHPQNAGAGVHVLEPILKYAVAAGIEAAWATRVLDLIQAGADYDVIVIGAGLAGLETAALLAQQGARVLVLERRPVIGGRAMVVRDAGFTLNYGLHYMMHGYANPHYRILEAG